MSVDNGVYVAKFEDGYRVCERSAVENLWYPEVDHPKALEEQARTFKGESFDLVDVNKAYKKAWEIHDEVLESIGIVEYGVSEIKFPHKYPKDHL